jgi:hypothetical protein
MESTFHEVGGLATDVPEVSLLTVVALVVCVFDGTFADDLADDLANDVAVVVPDGFVDFVEAKAPETPRRCGADEGKTAPLAMDTAPIPRPAKTRKNLWRLELSPWRGEVCFRRMGTCLTIGRVWHECAWQRTERFDSSA